MREEVHSESRVRLAFPGGNTIPPCRICTEPADLIVHPNGAMSQTEYAYCARCVDTALERAELVRP